MSEILATPRYKVPAFVAGTRAPLGSLKVEGSNLETHRITYMVQFRWTDGASQQYRNAAANPCKPAKCKSKLKLGIVQLPSTAVLRFSKELITLSKCGKMKLLKEIGTVMLCWQGTLFSRIFLTSLLIPTTL